MTKLKISFVLPSSIALETGRKINGINPRNEEDYI